MSRCVRLLQCEEESKCQDWEKRKSWNGVFSSAQTGGGNTTFYAAAAAVTVSKVTAR